MQHFAKFGYTDFYIAAGYKQKILKDFFKNKNYGWNINIINTGLKTMTGGRVRRLKPYLEKEPFFLTPATSYKEFPENNI